MNTGSRGVLAKEGNIIMDFRETGWKILYKSQKAQIIDLVANLVKMPLPFQKTPPYPSL
jgi:hypothetical protein